MSVKITFGFMNYRKYFKSIKKFNNELNDQKH